MAFCLSVKVTCMASENIYRTEIRKKKEVTIICAFTLPFRTFFSINADIKLLYIFKFSGLGKR